MYWSLHIVRFSLFARVIALLSLAMVSFGGVFPMSVRGDSLLDFGDATESWQLRRYDAAGQAEYSSVTRSSVPGQDSSAFFLPYGGPPQGGEVVRSVEGFSVNARRLNVQFFVPESLPEGAVLKVFVRDWDDLWWQVRFERFAGQFGRGTVGLSLPLAGSEAARRWQPSGHGRVWHHLTPLHVREVGVAFEPPTSDSPAEGVRGAGIYLTALTVEADAQSAPPVLSNLRIFPASAQALTPFELRFNVGGEYTNPFDTSEVSVEARIEGPDGTVENVPGFYFADFSFREPFAVGVRELLRPEGRPEFRVRFTPRQPGTYRVSLVARCGTTESKPKTTTIEVAPAGEGARGFVRVDPNDSRFLAYESGDIFQGIGMNVRSPYDVRYRQTVPFTRWRDEGLHLYRRLFPAYRRAGVNVVEVWMSSWWLALEWIPDAVGNHGVGWMNQYRAWMLDRLFQWAADNDIYLILVFHNHGKFGERHDTEWDRNPFNVDNGGFLESSTEFFDDERAFQAFERFTRYATARWGCHQNLLAWKLFTEIDLTGDDKDFYKQPAMARWHQRAGRCVKQQDPYDHIVTTHWMLAYTQINAAVASLPELDMLTTDAYYTNRRYGVARCLRLIRNGTAFGQKFDKPLVITEFGGSPHADSLGNLLKQGHAGIWQGFFCNAPVAPLFWWFGLSDERNLYGSTKALAKFAEGEDRRRFGTPKRVYSNRRLVHTLQNRQRLLTWIMDTKYYYSDRENHTARLNEDVTLKYSGLEPGVRRLQVLNPHNGEELLDRRFTVPATGSGHLLLPSFQKDIAAKIVPVDGDSP